MGSVLYAVVLDTSTVRIRVYKGTGDGAWTECDAANAPVHSGATHSYDAGMARSGALAQYIFVGYRPSSGAPNSVYLRRFDTTTETWETTDWAGIVSNVVSPNQSINVAPRGSGVLVAIMYTGIDWRSFWSTGGTWTYIGWSVPNNPLGTIQTDNADLSHSFGAAQAGGGALYEGSVAGDGTQGARPLVDAAVAQCWASFGGYVNDGGTHRIALFVRDNDGGGDFLYGISTNGPTFTTVGSIAPTTTTDPGIMGGAVVPYNGKWHVIWSGDGRGSIHMAISDDYATPAFGANTDVITGLGNDPALFATATADGVAVLYTDPTGPSVDLVWAVDGPSTAIELAGAIAGASTANATRLSLSHPLTGSSEGSAAGSASALAVSHALSGESAGAAQAAATRLTVGHALTGSVVGSALASGDLLVQGQAQFAGSAIGGSTATATRLSLSQPLAGSAAGSSQADAARLTVEHALAGLSAGTSLTAAQQLVVAHLLAGTITGSSAASGTLTDAQLFFGVFAATPTIVDRFAGTPTIVDRWAGTPDIG